MGQRNAPSTSCSPTPPYGKTWKTDLRLLAEGSENKDKIIDHRFVKTFKDGTELRMIPDVSDGQLLFLLNNIAKMKETTELGSRIVEVHNGSALFTGDAGNGASNARRYIIENDLLEAIIQLPENIFYNTGITTHIWVLSNKKEEKRKGKIQLIDASSIKTPLRKNLGKKNAELSEENKKDILNLFLNFKETEHSKIFPNEHFGYYKITVERPLKLAINLTNATIQNIEQAYAKLALGTPHINKPSLSEFGLKNAKTALAELSNPQKMEGYLSILKQLARTEPYLNFAEFTEKFNQLAKATNIKGLSFASLEKTGLTNLFTETNEHATIQKDAKGNVLVDANLRDTEIVPLNYPGGIAQFMQNEVLPYHADAFVNETETKIGYEISFTKYFYVPKQLDKVSDIVARIKKLEEETDGVLSGILEGLYE